MNERTASAIVSEMLEEVLGYLNDSQRKALLHDLIHEALLDQQGPAIEAIDRAPSHQPHWYLKRIAGDE